MLIRRRLLMIQVAVTPPSHSLVVGGATDIIAESFNMVAIYDEDIDVTNLVSWSIISGNVYATIDSAGTVTIDSAASANSVTIQATYNGLSATQEVIVTYKSGSSSHTETEVVTDPSGNTTTTTTTTTENEDGSSISSSQSTTYDASGNTTGSQTNETITNTDGSSSSTTINYNESGTPVSGENEVTDTDSNKSTQSVAYDESGNTTVTGYEIDTSDNPNGEKTFNGDGVNTEFIPFDKTNAGFICHIRFRTVKTEQPNPPIVEDTEDSGSNYLFNILTAKSPFKPYRGFHIRWALKKTNYSSGNLTLGYTSGTASSTTSRQIYGVNDIYDFRIIYDPQLLYYSSKFRVEDLQGRTSTISANIEFASNNMDFVLGYAINQEDQPYRYSNVAIYEFTIGRLTPPE